MKKTLLVLCCLAMTSGAAWAVDYSTMSNDQLSAQRGALYNATQEEWNAFHTEWCKRLTLMTLKSGRNTSDPVRDAARVPAWGGARAGWGECGCCWRSGAASAAQGK